jgi:hypothetical protein
MYIEKIEIPAFRVLRDVVLEFGEVYDPQIFPIGSENGGGKSTLLQLVFALLHCSADRNRRPYLNNLLESDFFIGNEDERRIAQLSLKVDNERHELEFMSLHNRFLSRQLEDPPQQGFDVWVELDIHKRSFQAIEARLSRYRQVIHQLEADRHEQGIRPQDMIKLMDFLEEGDLPQNELPRDAKELTERLQPEIDQILKSLNELRLKVGSIEAEIERISDLLTSMHYKYITTYLCPTPTGRETRALICRSRGRSASQTQRLLAAVASKVFLLGPSNQQYLFLGKDARKALLTARSIPSPNPRMTSIGDEPRPRPQLEYMRRLDEAEKALPGFFAYDWLSVEPLVQLFASARDEDFKNAVNTGNYGKSYSTLMSQVNELLLGKKVRPLDDLSGIEFVIENKGGRDTPLSPEDLSQGELKRLMIYAWLKANKAVDALVLIDEIEASFHPDWQLGIVHNLQDWAPKNQYLLATHSYDLCRALTPRHVRDLKPELRWKETTKTEVEVEVEDREPRDG